MSAPQIHIVLGEVGVGKNYCGQKLADKLGLHFYDGDESLPPDIKSLINNLSLKTLPNLIKTLNRDTVHAFVCGLLIHDVAALAHKHGGLVVSQALYSDVDRAILINHLGGVKKFDVRIHHVETSLLQQTKQLRSRKNGLAWVLYALASKPFFQNVCVGYKIWNRGSKTVFELDEERS